MVNLPGIGPVKVARKAILASVAVLLFISAVVLYTRVEINPFNPRIPSVMPAQGVINMSDDLETSISNDTFLSNLFNVAMKPDYNDYTLFGVKAFSLSESPKWREPLGQDLCIFDLDDRDLDGDGQIFSSTPLSWNRGDKVDGRALGTLQHWLYAKIHGYKYYFVRTNPFNDNRRGSWKKPSIMAALLKKHPYCIFADSDATFTYLDLPFEWLLNYWTIDRTKTSLVMAVDPQGIKWPNTGFIIGINRTETAPLLRDWAECADDGGKYPECVNYREKWKAHPSDQGGFAHYVQYDYVDDIVKLECTEANGFPEHGKCKGNWVRHLWTGKQTLLKIAIGQQVPGGYLEYLHRKMMEEKESYYVTEDELMSGNW